jgi:hypothetical protein
MICDTCGIDKTVCNGLHEQNSAKSTAEAIADLQRIAFEEGVTLARESIRLGYGSARAEHESLSLALNAAQRQLTKIRGILQAVDSKNANSWGAGLEMIAEVLDFKR